jgi:hypothetical protein
VRATPRVHEEFTLAPGSEDQRELRANNAVVRAAGVRGERSVAIEVRAIDPQTCHGSKLWQGLQMLFDQEAAASA